MVGQGDLVLIFAKHVLLVGSSDSLSGFRHLTDGLCGVRSQRNAFLQYIDQVGDRP